MRVNSEDKCKKMLCPVRLTSPNNLQNCVGEKCMAWVWHSATDTEGNRVTDCGYCGLAKWRGEFVDVIRRETC